MKIFLQFCQADTFSMHLTMIIEVLSILSYIRAYYKQTSQQVTLLSIKTVS